MSLRRTILYLHADSGLVITRESFPFSPPERWYNARHFYEIGTSNMLDIFSSIEDNPAL